MPAEPKGDNNGAIRAQVEQLRYESKIQRKKISEAGKDLMEYCEKNRPQDTLINGANDGHNPFQEKRGCVLT